MRKAQLKETINIRGQRVWCVGMIRSDCEVVFAFKKKSQAKQMKRLHDEAMPLISVYP